MRVGSTGMEFLSGLNIFDGDFRATLTGSSDTFSIDLFDGSGNTNQLYLDIEDVTSGSANDSCVRIEPTKVAVGSATKPALMVGGAGNLAFHTASKDGHIRCNDVGGKLIFEAGDGTNVGEVAKMGPGGLEVIGDVGIVGTDTPELTIRTATTGNDPAIELRDGAGTEGIDIFYDGSGEIFRINGTPAGGSTNTLFQMNADKSGSVLWSGLLTQGSIVAAAGDLVSATGDLLLPAGGIAIDLGAAPPSYPIDHSSGAHLTAAGVWVGTSSRAAKRNIKNLSQRDADAAFAMLAPKKFEYKVNGEKHLGFIAEDVHDLVATEDRKGLSSMDIVAVLAKVMQKQSKTLDKQSKALDKQSKALSKQQKQISKLEKALKAKK